MTKISELESEINQMRKALSNPQLPPNAKGNLESAIGNAEKELKKLKGELASKDTEKPEEKPVVKKPSAKKTAKTKAEKPKADDSEIPTKAELKKNADIVPTEKLHEFKRVRIGCEMFADKNDTDNPVIVDFVGGEMVAYPGDWILYLGDGHPFTIIQKENFEKRCIVLQEGEKSQLTVKKSDGTIKKVKNTEGGIIETPKKKKHRMTPSVEKGIENLASKMQAKDCDIAQFIQDTEGTPIDDSIWGRIAQWNKKTTAERITKVGIEKDTENPRFIAETVDYSEMFRTIRYYSVCLDKGTWSLIPDIEKSEIAKKFDKKGFRMQYSRAEMNRMYNYGDPSVKSYDKHLMECKTLAADAYKTRIESGSADARPKYQKHYNTCRNTVMNEYNRKFLIDLNELARKHKEENKSLSFRDAFKAVRAKLKTLHI